MNRLSRDRIVVVGHENPDFDSLASGIIAQYYLCALGYEARFFAGNDVSDDVLSSLGFDLSDYSESPASFDALFLVDHNSTSYHNYVVGCIDHHPTNERRNYEFYYNQPSSSAALSVFRIGEEDGISFPDKYRILALYSVYMDTMALKSAKFVPSDLDFVNETVDKYGIDRNKLQALGLMMSDLERPIEVIASYDLKYCNFGNTRIASSHIRSEKLSEKLIEDVISAIKKRVRDEALSLWVLIVADPLNEHSWVLEISDKVVCRKFDRLISRSIDIMPELEKRFSDRKR